MAPVNTNPAVTAGLISGSAITENTMPTPFIGNVVNDAMRALNQMVIFDPSAISLTAGAGGLNRALSAAQNILNSSQVYLFRFLINPSKFSYLNKKIAKHILEKKGWETVWFDGTPDEMITLGFSGSTGSLVPPSILFQAGIMDIKLSANYQRFCQLRSLIKSSKNDLNLIYDGIMYTGVLNDFKFDQDALNPYQINYSFSFAAYPDRIDNIASIDFSTSGIPVVSNVFQSGVGF